MTYTNSAAFAAQMDEADPLKTYREEFYIPLVNGKPSYYFTGNSLGLQSKNVQEYVLKELENWANFGVEGHFHMKDNWYSYHDFFPEKVSKIVGCKPAEVVIMNSLTVNIHLLLISFYRPTQKRYKILCEAKAFPSDQYALESQVKLKGFDPADAIIEVSPENGENAITTESILATIEKHKDELALVYFGGINYYNGQVFDMKAITAKAHKIGAFCGFDLAHAAGNVELHLHDWQVDFACWCTYKYLNSGPGSIGGVYINEQHAANPETPRLAGWWGYEKDTRFKMEKGFKPITSAEGFQLSNPSILDMAAHRAAIDLFDKAGFPELVKKSKSLTGFAQFILDEINTTKNDVLEVLTPRAENERGCQLSILIKNNAKHVFDHLKQQGVICDWREPGVIRIAPAPIYNSFMDVYQFGQILQPLLRH
ncbi:MAG: kynureninase [Ginsengibacter sp.]